MRGCVSKAQPVHWRPGSPHMCVTKCACAIPPLQSMLLRVYCAVAGRRGGVRGEAVAPAPRGRARAARPSYRRRSWHTAVTHFLGCLLRRGRAARRRPRRSCGAGAMRPRASGAPSAPPVRCWQRRRRRPRRLNRPSWTSAGPRRARLLHLKPPLKPGTVGWRTGLPSAGSQL